MVGELEVVSVPAKVAALSGSAVALGVPFVLKRLAFRPGAEAEDERGVGVNGR
jgi:hypothetical protein